MQNKVILNLSKDLPEGDDMKQYRLLQYITDVLQGTFPWDVSTLLNMTYCNSRLQNTTKQTNKNDYGTV